MNKHRNSKIVDRNDSWSQSDSIVSTDFLEVENAAYEEPNIEQPAKHSISSNCGDCGAYYNRA